MYEHILVTLDATAADRTILEHIVPLATMCKSKVTLLHVADGWAARTHGADAVSKEVTEDRAYLAKVKDELESRGVFAQTELAFGDPATEIIKWVRKRGCSLVAMSTHGHRFIADFFLGTAADTVRHEVEVPVLLIKAKY
ncbi:MAG TPA: universal stress protein [Pirellulaceae bacterium]|jgi:nucleotide-binding universal stress UspA family protein